MKFWFLTGVWLIAFCSFGQIASDGFEGSSIFTITNGAYKSGNSGASDGPASSPFHVGGNQGYGCNNTTITLISPVYDLSCYTNISLSFRLAAFSLTNATNGVDAGDNVQVFISTNGGGSYTNYLQVNGNSNAYWAFSATGTATTAYPTVTSLSAASGGNNAAGYSTLSITSLPSSASLVIKIVALNNSANELWVIDDFSLNGTFTGCTNTISTGTLSASTYSVNCSTAATGTVTFTSTGTFNAGNVYTVQLSDASGSFSSPISIGTFTSTANSGSIPFTIPAATVAGSGYQIQIVSSNPVTTGGASSAFSITGPYCGCPILTGAIVNSCDNPGCNEGDAEIMFFNSGNYSITMSSMPSHVVNYAGNTTNYNNGTVNAYTGSPVSNSSTTSTLNGFSGCSGAFVDANAAGTIPANSTFIMVPNTFCPTNYDFSNICASANPIYVVYFGTTGWNTSGNLANYQSGSNPKYLTVDFSWVGGCGSEYYTFDAGSEYSGGTGSGDGAAIGFPQSVSTSSPTPTNANYYSTSSNCVLPVIILPIHLVEFKTTLIKSGVSQINFTTEKENNVKQYIISRSFDGQSYIPFKFIKAHNTSERTTYLEYDYMDESGSDVIYYRLQEEDFNGLIKTDAYSILEVKTTTKTIVSSMGEEVLVRIPVPASVLQIFSVDGTRVKNVECDPNTLFYQINIPDLAKGFYIVSVTDMYGKTTVVKVIL